MTEVEKVILHIEKQAVIQALLKGVARHCEPEQSTSTSMDVSE